MLIKKKKEFEYKYLDIQILSKNCILYLQK